MEQALFDLSLHHLWEVFLTEDAHEGDIARIDDEHGAELQQLEGARVQRAKEVCPEAYLTESVCKVALQKPISAHIRQFVLYYYD